MGFNCGIVGLPNVGKSTLFNALTSTQAAEAANYPFCTIEPNIGRVSVPDTRLEKLASIVGSSKIIPTQLEFIDIAGLVRGASKGNGLGNQFLANIRGVDAILHVLRCFDGDVAHVEGSVDPIRDAEIVDTELMIVDLESVERRLQTIVKLKRLGKYDRKVEFSILERVLLSLREGLPARAMTLDPEEVSAFRYLQLLSAKSMLYICNVDEAVASTGNQYSSRVEALAQASGSRAVVIAATIESEVAQLATLEAKMELLESLGLREPGLNKVIQAGYQLLNLLTFFTVGPKEVRAWTIERGATALEAAGVIHSDFQRGFIKAEIIDYNSYITLGGEQACREAGCLRQEGRGYVIEDGDVIHFRSSL
jgi:GTP-binding protein YchF